MSLAPSQPLNQVDLTTLDRFLRSNACGGESMGLSYAHGFLTAVASGPERLDSAEWLRLMFDEPVFVTGNEAEAILSLALRLFGEIELGLRNESVFCPIFDHVRDKTKRTYVDAQPWCLGFVAGIKLFSEYWTTDANRRLNTPLELIFRLANMHGQPDADYTKLCDAVPHAAEAVFQYWQMSGH